MDFLDAMQTYFRGERGIGLTLVPVGLAFVAASFWVWRTQDGGFVWGLVIPLLIAGLGAAAGGGFLAVKTDAQVSQLQTLYEQGPAELAAVEVPRMAKVNANWPKLKAAWASIMIVALGLLLFVHKDWVTGTALSLVVLMAMVLVLDVFAERRAIVYSQALERLAPPAIPSATARPSTDTFANHRPSSP